MKRKHLRRLPLRPSNEAPLPHPINIGIEVFVFRLLPYRMPFFEGVAIVRALATGSHTYLVEFRGDPVPKQRVVHPAFQSEPGQVLMALLAIWQADQFCSDLDEAFPDEVP